MGREKLALQAVHLSLAERLADRRLGLSPKSSDCALPTPHHMGRKENPLQGLKMSQSELLGGFPGKKGLEKKIWLGLDRVIEGELRKKPEHVEVFVT